MSFFKNSSVRKTWISSYIVVFLIPFLFSILSYVRAQDILVEEVSAHNQTILQGVSRKLDDAVAGFSKLTHDISYSARIADIMEASTNGVDSPEVRYEFYKLAQDVFNFKISANCVNNIMIYFDSLNRIVTINGMVEPEQAFMTEFSLKKVDFGQGYEILRKRYAGEFFTIGEGNNKKLYYACSNLKDMIEVNRLNLFFEIDVDSLLSESSYANKTQYQQIAIMKNDGKYLAGNINEEMLEFIGNQNLSLSGETDVEKINGENYIISQKESEQNNIRYIYFVSENQVYQKIYNMRILLYLSMILCIVIGVGSIIILTKKSYSPIEQLLQLVKGDNTIETLQNEFDYINYSIKKLNSETKEYISRLSKEERFFRNEIIAKLLRGQYGDILEIEDILQSMDIVFNEDYFTVLMFYVEDITNIFFENNSESDSEEDKMLARVVISSVFTDLLAEKNYKAAACESDGLMVLIVNHNADSEHHKKCIDEIILNGKHYIETEFNIFLTVGVSDGHYGIEGISICYSEAVSCVEQRFLNEQEKVIRFDELKHKKHSGYYFPLELEQKLIYYLKAGQYEECISVVDDVLAENFNDKTQMSVSLAKCFMLDLLCSVIKVEGERKDVSVIEKLDAQELIEEIIECETASLMVDKMKIFVQKVCTYFSQMQQNLKSGLKEKMDLYLEMNYSDSSLDIEAVGRYFDLNPMYLSRRFKEQYNIGLLEYINRFRVEKAKEILLTKPKLTLEQVGKESGFYSIRTFTRVFTKYAGISPGRFKEINANNIGG